MVDICGLFSCEQGSGEQLQEALELAYQEGQWESEDPLLKASAEAREHICMVRQDYILCAPEQSQATPMRYCLTPSLSPTCCRSHVFLCPGYHCVDGQFRGTDR